MWRQHLLIGLFCSCGVLGSAQDLLVYGLIRERPARAPITGATISLEDSSLVPLDRWLTGDSGDYEFYLQMDQVYTLRCSAPGYFPKSVVLDTRNVDASAEDREGGWGMNIDMTLYRTFEGVDTALLNVPFGYAAWNAADTMFAWDMPHTEKIRAQWAAILPAEADVAEQASVRPSIDMAPPPVWTRFAVALAVVLLGRWGLALLFARIGDDVQARQRLLVAMLVGAAILGSAAWLHWSGTGWEHVLAFGAVVGAVGLVVVAVRQSGPVLDHGLENGIPIADEERARGRKFLKVLTWSAYIVAMISGFLLYAVWGRTLQDGTHLLHNAGWAMVLLAVLLLLLHRPVRRWFLHPADRVRFWLVLGGALLVIVPTAVQLMDRQLVGPASGSRIAEIVELNEVSGRRGRRTFHAIVLVDGVEKDIAMDKAEWDELTYTDALSLTIQRGPTGIDHITGWDAIYRGEE